MGTGEEYKRVYKSDNFNQTDYGTDKGLFRQGDQTWPDRAHGGQIFQLSTPEGDQSHAVWINDFGQVTGWIENGTADPCAFGVGVQNHSQAVIWQFGRMIPLGTLGGTDSYGEFINNLGQV